MAQVIAVLVRRVLCRFEQIRVDAEPRRQEAMAVYERSYRIAPTALELLDKTFELLDNLLVCVRRRV